MNINFIHTLKGISMVLHGRPYSVANDSPIFDEVSDLVYNDGSEDDVLAVLQRVENKLKGGLRLTHAVTYDNGVVLRNGVVLHNYAVDRLIDLIERGLDVSPLANFLDRLQKNTSNRVVENLYAFLEHGNVPLTPSGNFVVYKAVRKDFMDIYSGTKRNMIGDEVSMERNQVDEDQDRTCSHGLHVCSFDYLPHFAHADGHVMICEVDPADVVAIPRDYDNTKMRVSRYKVIGEVSGYYKDHEDVLSKADSGLYGVEETYRVKFGFDNDLGISFFTLDEAEAQADKLRDRYWDVWVEDQDGLEV